MTKKILLFISLSLFVMSCSSSKKVANSSVKKNKTTTKATLADKVVWTAMSYKGTPYKYNGTTKRGMDCSGLMYVSFKKRGIELPRSSSVMATKGKAVSLKSVRRGDLVFFKTGRRNRISHVGLVISNKGGNIKFVHSSTSKGVIVSSIREKYWKRAYRKAKRLL